MVEIGEFAPDFELPDQHRSTVRLVDLRGRKVVLVFYPFAFTSVCTSELRAIRDALPALQNHEVQVLAVSCDATGALRAFADAEGLDFPLLSDFWPHGAVAGEYGVFDERLGAARRGTFVVAADGVVRGKIVSEIGQPRDLGAYQRILAEI